MVQECRRSAQLHGFSYEVLEELRRCFRPVKNRNIPVHYLNLVDKFFPENRNPVKKDFESAKSGFVDLIMKLKPDYIVSLGGPTTKQLTGKTISNWAGRVLNVYGHKVIPVYHPHFAYKTKKAQREYEMQMRNAIRQICHGEPERKPTNYTLIMDEEGIINALEEFKERNKLTAYDWETTHLDPDNGVPICLNLSDEETTATVLYWYDRFGGPGLTRKIKMAIAWWLNSDVPKVAHNAKFEIKWGIRHFGVEPQNLIGDTQQIHHLLDPEASAGLKDLAYQHTDMGGYDLEMQNHLDRGIKHHDVPPETMVHYAGGDGDCTLRVYNVLKKELKKDPKLNWLWENVTLPSIFTLARMELRGMHIDFERVQQVEADLHDRVRDIKEAIADMPEVRKTVAFFYLKNPKLKLKEVNLKSPVQVRHLLYKACKLTPPPLKKKQVNPSTDKDAMDSLAGQHVIIEHIKNLRSAEYDLSVLDVLKSKRRKDDTVYSDLVQDYVLTGRLSSRNPNLTNVKTGSVVKGCFNSRFTGGKMVQADWDQLEIKLIGGEANDAFFIEAYKDGRDIHMETAIGIHEKPEEEITDAERTDAKRTNFGVIYGITEHGLSIKLKKSKTEAMKILDAWWRLHPAIRKWSRKNVNEARKNGFVRNRLGRRRNIEGLDSDKEWVVEAAERLCTNSKIQSLGADINMYFMTTLDSLLIKHEYKSVLVGQVHDSVIVDTHPEETEMVKVLIKWLVKKMNQRLTFLRIPLTMSIEQGDNWNDMEE